MNTNTVEARFQGITLRVDPELYLDMLRYHGEWWTGHHNSDPRWQNTHRYIRTV